MYAEEENIPSDPDPNQLFIDDIGIVWRWNEDESKWLKTFYQLDEMEEKTLVRVIRFYKDVLNEAPEEMMEGDYDKDSLNDALDFFMKKFGEGNE